jgi:acyl carrier protein
MGIFQKNGIMADKLQEQVAGIWAQALGVKKVGADDNFFALGGHSLLGVKLIAEIQAKTGMEEELKLSDLLEFPTLAAFTGHLESLMAPSEESGTL